MNGYNGYNGYNNHRLIESGKQYCYKRFLGCGLTGMILMMSG
jgi:hypothetical protein